jgi:DNA modification methylase
MKNWRIYLIKLNHIYQGEALEVLKTFPDKSINMIMTSPPYWGLRDYGTAEWKGGNPDCNHYRDNKSKDSNTGHRNINHEHKIGVADSIYKDICKKCGAIRIDNQLGLESNFNEYINKLCNIFDEVKRVLKDDGTCWVNLGDTYSGGIPGSGGSGKKSGLNCKRNKDKTFHKDNKSVLRFKSNKINYIVPNKSLCQIPQRFSIEMTDRGWILRNVIIWHKKNCMPSSVKDRFTVDFEYLFFFAKNKKYYFEQQFEKTIEIYSEKRAKRPITSHGKEPTPSGNSNNLTYNKLKPEGRNKRTVWTINPKPFKDAHFAVYPEELCITPIKAGCPAGGIVLDPFFGSGTTGAISLKLDRKFIGIELNPEYIEIAKKRLKPLLEQGNLFD